MALGIGIVTYNRRAALERTVQAIRRYTVNPYYLIVADDNGGDGTVSWCRGEDIPTITGQNRGVCWNKNRALSMLLYETPADQILLLEDDCWPEMDGWDSGWVTAAQQFHHVNYAHPTLWPPTWRNGGSGTPTDPWRTWEITGQATVTARDALSRVGFLNTQFRGYGYGHIEWTERFCKAHFIDRDNVPCMRHGLKMEELKTFRNSSDVSRNYVIANKLRTMPFKFQPPWNDGTEQVDLMKEIQQALYYNPVNLRRPRLTGEPSCSTLPKLNPDFGKENTQAALLQPTSKPSST